MPGGLRTARHCVFTGGVVVANSICRAGFLRKQSRSGKRARPLRLTFVRQLPQSGSPWQSLQASSLCQGLSLWESRHRAAMIERARTLTAARLFPQETSAATAVFLCDPTRENAMPGGPQTARHCSIISNFSAEYAQSTTTTTAASGGNREELLGQRPARRKCRPRHDADAGCRNPIAERIQIIFLRTAPQPPDAPAKHTAMPRRTGSPP